MDDFEHLEVNSLPDQHDSLAQRLIRIGTRIFKLPGLRRFKPFARRIKSVAAPTNGVAVRNCKRDCPQQPCAGMAVLSANLWHDWPRFRDLDRRIENFAQLVERHNVDVLLLQEVARTSEVHIDERLAKRLGMCTIYSRANGTTDGIGFEEGVAVLSRCPMSAPVLRELSMGSRPFSRRLALGVQVKSHCGTFMAFTTHLSITPSSNRIQFSRLIEWVNEVSGDMPAVIGGDFNSDEVSKRLHKTGGSWLDSFRQMHPEKGESTHEIRWPWGGLIHKARLDYIFVKPGGWNWEVVHASHQTTPELRHSDHKAVLTRLVPANG